MNHIEFYKDPSKIDWKTPVVIDFETYYDKEYSLSKITMEKYIRCDKFECIGVAVKIGNNPTHFHKGETGIEIIRHIVTTTYPNSPVVVQNCSFDCGILAFRYDIHPNFMVDTMVMAKLSGFDRVAGGTSLAKMSAQLEKMGIFSQVKGNEVHNMLGVHASDMTPQQWQAYGDYCKLDVDLTHALYMYMIDKVPVSELIMSDITTKMWTKPVIELDVPLLKDYAVRLDEEREQMLSRISGDLGFDSTDELLKHLRSSKKFAALLESLQVEVPMKWSEKQEKMIPAVSKTDTEFLELLEHENELVRTLVETKLGTMSSMEQTRTATFLDIASRGLMPLPLRYSGTHTHRFSGMDSLNVQNLAKRTKDPVLRRSMRAMDGHIILASDSSNIEVRVGAYIANQQDVIEVFRKGGDVYIDMAAKIYNESYDDIYEQSKGANATKEGKMKRNIAKAVVLGASFGASAGKFAELMKQQGLAEQADMADELITTYRTANNMISGFWRECQRVLDVMYAGGSCWFGGMDNDLFFADGSSEFYGKKIPSIRLPNGAYIFYQNLRKEVGDDGKVNYVYDQFKGRNWLPKRIWGSAFFENLCIAEDTLVLTDSGWKKIQDITDLDKVHDGVEFVTHGGLVFKSVKDCVKIDGVYMTKDHEVLTNDGWKTAEVHLSTGAASQLSRFDFSEVWQADRYPSNSFRRKKMALGLPMRVRENCEQERNGCEKDRKKRWNAPLRLQHIRDCFEQGKLAWLLTSSNLLDMEKYESTLSKSKTQSMEKLWWQGYNCLRAMVRLPRVLNRYATELSAGVGLRPQGQQPWVLQGELPMGHTAGELQQQAQQRVHTGRQRASTDSRVLRDVQPQPHNGILSTSTGGDNAATGGTTQPSKAVYDILNCGSRNRFVVKGDTAPFVVHNCQALSFVILKYQAIEIAKAGVPINLNVHDEWVSVVPREQAPQAVVVMYKAMKSVPDYIPQGLLDCEVDVGWNYGTLHTIPNKEIEKCL